MSVLSIAKFALKQSVASPLSFQKVIGPSTDQPILQKLILESFAESGININRTNTGRINLENVTDETIDKFNSTLRQKKAEAGLPRSRYEVANEKTEIKKFVQNKLKNKEYVSLPRIYEEFPNTNDATIRRALSENVIKKLGKEEAAEAARKTGQAAGKAKLTESDDVIKAINDEFKFDPDVPDSKTIAERIYGSDFTNANSSKQLDFIKQTENDLIKYLRVLEGAREKPKGMVLPKQTQINDIVDNMLAGGEREGFKRGFRFSPGILRDYQFSIRDSLLNLKEGTTAAKRAKLGTRKGMELDEIFSLGATFRRAPGYTEAFQFIPSKINQQKSLKIDRPLSSLLDAIEQGKTEVQYGGKKVSIEKAVQLFNKDSKSFGNKNKILTPQINLGKSLDDLSAYSPEAQKNIQDVFKTKNYSLSVQKPKSKIQTFSMGVGGASLALPVQAQDQTDLLEKGDIDYGDPETWDKKVGQFIEEAPILSGTAAAATPLLTKPGRKIYGQAAKQILRGAGTPLGLVMANLGFGVDPASSLDRAILGTELALSPLAVKEAAKFGPRVQQVMNLGLKPATALRYATRFGSPLGILTLAGEGGYQFYQALEDEKARIAAMSPEERQMFEEEQTAAAYMGEAENFANGGRVEMAGGGLAALKALLNFLGKGRGKKGSELLQEVNPKKYGTMLENLMLLDDKKMVGGFRVEYLETLLDTIKNDKAMLDKIKQMPVDQQESFFNMINQGANQGRLDVYKTIDPDEAILEIEQMIKNLKTKDMSPEEIKRSLNAYGGRVRMKIGGDPKDKKKTPFDKPTLPIDPNAPQDPGRRTFMEGMGLGGLGIAGLLSGAIKFAPEIKKAVTGVTTQMTEVPNIIKELYATIKNLGQVTDYSKKGVVKTKLGPYELNEYPGGYNITKMTDSDFRYQQEYFGVQTDPEYGVIDYEELTALPDMDGKLKDVDYGVELNTYREIGEDLAKIKNDDSLIKIADDDIAKQIEKEEALKESLGKKGMGEND